MTRPPHSFFACALGAFALSACSHTSHRGAPAASAAPHSVAPAVASAAAPTVSSLAKPSAAPAVASAAPGAKRSRAQGSCHVHWSADGSEVAIVDGAHIGVERLAGGAWIKSADAPPGARFVDYSLTRGLALERRGKSYRLVDPSTGRVRFSAALAGAATAQLSEDGEHVVFKPAKSSESLFVLDLASGKRRAIRIPMFSAGGSDTVPLWVRRRSVQVSQSRIASGFFDYLAKPSAGGRVPLLSISNCFATTGQGTGAFYGADTDAAFRTAVVARKPCESKPHIARIEVHRRAAGSDHFKLTKSWPVSGKFLALWLSPDGGRVIVRARQRGKIRNTVYDTHTGKARGSVVLHGGCFAFSADGARVAEKIGHELRVSALP